MPKRRLSEMIDDLAQIHSTTGEKIEAAIWDIDKPLRKITLYDVTLKLEELQNARAPQPPT